MIVIFLLAMLSNANNWKQSKKAKEFPDMKIATLNIVTSLNVSPDAKEDYDIVFPDYLSDLRDVSPDKKWNMKHPCKYTFSEDPHNAEESLNMGEILELYISGDTHPPHIHVNHMQIMESTESWPKNWISSFSAAFDASARSRLWYKPGEWYDNFATTRYAKLPAKEYSGPYIFHCHWLQHEDLGCMGIIQVNGDSVEGSQTYFPADPAVKETHTTAKVDFTQANLELQQPTQISWEDFIDDAVNTKLYLDTVVYDGPTTQYVTRGYNGNIPGPTLKLKRGTTVTVELHNFLGANAGEKILNHIGVPNTTNLHTHGLHISPHQPGDDNLHTKVEPGMAVRYQYDIPADHMGGTHWYHPHYHASTALQTGGGAMGMIIIDDEDSDNIPDWIRNATEIQMVATNMPQTLDDVSWLERTAGGNLPHPTASSEFMLLNGMYMPKITMEQNKWYRWRWVTGTMNYFVFLELKQNGCEYFLLATDGVYIPDGLRKIDYLAGSSGNRADVLVRCKTIGTFDLNTVQTPEFTKWYQVWWVWLTLFVLFILSCCCCTCCAFCVMKFYKARKAKGTGGMIWDEPEEVEFVMSDKPI